MQHVSVYLVTQVQLLVGAGECSELQTQMLQMGSWLLTSAGHLTPVGISEAVPLWNS